MAKSWPSDVRDLVPALTLGVAVLLWVAGFDIIYACQDVESDVQARLHSVPARVGVRAALARGRALSLSDGVRLAGVAAGAPRRADHPCIWDGFTGRASWRSACC